MIFHVFYSKFSLYASFKNAFPEHLKWLNFQKFSGGFTHIREDCSTWRLHSCIADWLWQIKYKVSLNQKYSTLFNVSDPVFFI